MVILYTFILVISLIASLLAMQNTYLLRKDIERLKEHFNIQEQRDSSILHRDLDND